MFIGQFETYMCTCHPALSATLGALVAAACATKELHELPSLFVYVIMIAADAALPWRHLALLRHANVNMKSFCPLFMTPSTQGQDMLLTPTL